MIEKLWRGLFGAPTRLRPLQRPQAGRHASWLELFFDLVFVVAVSQVAHLLDGELTWAGAAQFTALFVVVWWSWLGYTFYADFFESDDAFYRVTMFSGMFGMAALAVSAPHAFDGGAAPFVWSFLAVRVFLLVLYLRARAQVPVARAFADRFLLGFGVGAAFWLASLFFPAPLQPWLWALGFTVEVLSLFVRGGRLQGLPFDSEHIPERFGLFVILVLGEAVLAVTGGIAEEEWGVRAVVVAAVCFGLAVSLWWLYFDHTEVSAARGGWSWRTQGYIYSHLPLVLGLVLVGVGARYAILGAQQATLPWDARFLLAGGSALAVLAMTALRLAAGGRRLLWARGLVVAALALWSGAGASPVLWVAGTLTLLAGLVGLEARTLRRLGGPEQAGHGASPVVEGEDVRFGRCGHMTGGGSVVASSDGCEDCRRLGDRWVELRVCLSCGYVGCCDSSKNGHATAHFQAEGHPVVRSFQPDEQWAWCYLDQRYVDAEVEVEGAPA